MAPTAHPTASEPIVIHSVGIAPANQFPSSSLQLAALLELIISAGVVS